LKSSNNFRNKDIITIGRIVKTHGIHGRLRLRYYNEDKNSFFAYRMILLMNQAGNLVPFEVTEAKIHQDLILVQLDGVDSLDQAENLVGASVLVEKAALPELKGGEYYWADLIGMEVTDVRGVRLGEVFDIISTGGTDVFVIKMDEKEILIPATEEVIREVDVALRRMVVSPLEGLVEDDPI
jgi:16S rRNA processing protein RimM